MSVPVPPVIASYRASDYYDQLNVFNYISLVKLIGDSAKFEHLKPVCKNQDKVIEKRKAEAVSALVNRYMFEEYDSTVEVTCAEITQFACCGVDYDTLASTPVSEHQIIQDIVAVAGGVLAIPLTYRGVDKTTTGVEALTVADGLFIGQRLNINLVVDGGNASFTFSTSSAFSSITFANAGDWVEVEWTYDGWRIIGIGGANGATAQPVVTL